MKNLLSSFVELVHLQSEMNKLFEALQDLQEGGADPHLEGGSPPYDILGTPDEILVQVDLPGVRPGTLQVSVEGNVVTMQGEKAGGRKRGIVAYHLMERDRGAFIRRLRIEGAINTHQGKATYDKGVLTLRFPRVTDQRGRGVTLTVDVVGPISAVGNGAKNSDFS